MAISALREAARMRLKADLRLYLLRSGADQASVARLEHSGLLARGLEFLLSKGVWLVPLPGQVARTAPEERALWFADLWLINEVAKSQDKSSVWWDLYGSRVHEHREVGRASGWMPAGGWA